MAKKKATLPAAKASLNTKDDLVTLLAAGLNKTFDNEQVAFNLGTEDTPSDVKEWISTGSTLLNIAISNKPEGGFPVGKISLAEGLEGSGKSLISAHALTDTQRRGGVAVLIDTENAVTKEFLIALGIDTNKLLYVPLNTIEDCLQAVEQVILKVREQSKDRLVTIVVDSIAGATTKVEEAADFEKDGYSTTKAIVLSKGMRKLTNLIGQQRVCLIFTNQLREKLNAMAFGDKYTAPGGKALPFHASVRLRVTSIGKLKKTENKISHVIGIDTQVKVTKNRLGPPHRVVEFPILFDSGIDDCNSWLPFLVKVGAVVKTGAYCHFKDDDSKISVSDWPVIMRENEEYRQKALTAIADAMIMKYKIEKDTLNFEEVESDTQDE